MSNIFIILFVSLLISQKTLSLYIEECSDKYDCFNCTLTYGCKWENKTCINFTDINYNSTLLDSDNSTILFHDLKILRNICFENKVPSYPLKTYLYDNLYDELSEKYCGSNFIILNDGKLINGYRIELLNNTEIYGTPNLLCEYVLTHGRARIDADIFINRSLSQDFLLFYTDDLDESIQINYSTTLSIYGMHRNSVSFLFYSNKSFETSPFIIYFKIEVPEYFEEEDSVVLTYIFLAAIIGFIALAVGGIIIVRKCSIFFNLNKNKNDSNINENLNHNKGDLSIISEKNVEENSINEMEIDLQELKTIKGNNIEQDKNNNDDKDKK